MKATCYKTPEHTPVELSC